MDEDYDPLAGDTGRDENSVAGQDDDEDDFVQDGPDLFGAEPVPAVTAEDAAGEGGMAAEAGVADDSATLDEPTPPDDVDDQFGEDDPRDTLLTGPETPEEPDGLESEDEIDGDEPPAAAARTAGAAELPDTGPDGLTEPASTAGSSDGVEPRAAVATPRPVGQNRPADRDPGEPPLALYRRYRPDTFDEVIGQEHVTEPLKRAIINNRVNHAYLFSGPRGCGKTTSARILARALNCEKGPTPNPCGECQSCRDLARGGPGSIDVIEIDAASHGGVDDARDLRERAFFSPVSSRYKIYIIDEAHMVTTQGFNALLKLVEEPPPHVKFIFATTEPEKVIGTIRSRTHHYPFRLVPPKTLIAYLRVICDKEGIHVDPAVLPLVVRAGGGSVRDSLSVLDQLLGGAEEDGVSYRRAAALLGYTPDALLDEIVDAFAAGDAHEVFATIDKVIEIGQDPRRFAEDLLRRVRDLVILSAVPDACLTGLIDASPEQATRLGHQAAGMGPGELTRAAEVLATGLTQMRGTTAPRLHLELMCSRVLLPGSDSGERGYNARLERLERRVGIAGAGGGELAVDAGMQPEVETASGAPVQLGASSGSVTPQQGMAQAPGPQSGQEATGWAEEQSGVPQQPSPQPTRDTPVQPGQQPSPGRPGASGGRRRPRPSERNYGSAPAQQPPARPVGGSSSESGTSHRAVDGPASQQAPAGPASQQLSPGPVSRQPPVDSANRAPAGSAARPGADRGPAGGSEGAASSGPAAGIPTVDIAMLRREWPRVLDVVKGNSRMLCMVLSQYSQVLEVHGRQATIGFGNSGALDMFASGQHPQALRDAVVEVLGAELEFVPVLSGPGGGQVPGRSQGPGPSQGPASSWGAGQPQSTGYSQGPGPSREEPPGPTEPGRGGTVRPGAGESDGVERVADRSEAGSAGTGLAGPDQVGTRSAQADRPGTGSAGRGPTVTGSTATDLGATATHRWSARAKQGIRPMSHRVEEPPPEEEDIPPAEWESEVVETPQISAAELIRTELGGVVINDPRAD